MWSSHCQNLSVGFQSDPIIIISLTPPSRPDVVTSASRKTKREGSESSPQSDIMEAPSTVI